MTEAAMTIREFCLSYKICRATFYNEVRRGNLRAVKMGTKTLVLHEDAEAWAGNLPEFPKRRRG
jgi:hypothetical protein